MQTYFRARPKDFGAVFVPFTVPLTATANTTVTSGIGCISDKDTAAPVVAHVAYVDEIHVAAVTAPVDADGTTLLSVIKYDSSAAATVTLVTDFNLEGLTSGKADKVPFDSGVTDQQRTLDYGDMLYYTVVNNSAAFDTAMAGGVITVLTKLIV